MKQTIGIDLGTTFSAVAAIDKFGRPVTLPNSQGKVITPSVIYFGGGQPIVGDEAKEMQALGDERVASFFKRYMGERSYVLNFNGKDYGPVDLSAILLRKLKADAQTALSTEIRDAVITVPAYFNNLQREATMEAGRMAGLNVLRIINEPTAAAIAYGMDKASAQQTVVVYDLGGGTFDVTVVRISPKNIEVIATDGNHELGGKDWDDRIAAYVGQSFLTDYGVDPLDDLVSFNDILVRCEKAKKELSARDGTRVSISHKGQRGNYELSRATFETITKDLMERTKNLTEQVLKDSSLTWNSLSGVLLVGGSTRMPMVSDYLQQMSGKKPLSGINVDEAVALGASIQAHMDANGQNGEQETFTLAGRKSTTDVMSHSLGIVAENGDRSKYVNSIIIPKNKTVPCIESRPFNFYVSRNQENKLEVHMLQGEQESPSKCVVIGKYVFSDFTPVKTNPVIVDIEYSYDNNGIVTVVAKERETGKTLHMDVEPVPDDMSWLEKPPPEIKHVIVHSTVIIAVDLSGSMSGQPLAEAQKAAKRFMDGIDLTHASIGLIVFADSTKVTQTPCQNAKDLNKDINRWTDYMSGSVVGCSNAAEPFTKALDLLHTKEDPRYLIVLTDGCWNDQPGAVARARKCHQEGVEVIAIGFGGADKNFLKDIATSDENALYTNLGDLVSSFSRIAQVLTDSGGMVPDDKNKTKTKGGFLKIFGKF